MLKFTLMNQPNTTITMYPTAQELASKNPVKAVMQRLAKDAPETRFIPVSVTNIPTNEGE